MFFRCCAALRDVSKAKYLKELSKMVQKYEIETVSVNLSYKNKHLIN